MNKYLDTMTAELGAIKILDLNAKLQQKKNAVRSDLKNRGVLQKAGKNDFDHYKYFSEAQYKELFTDLFSKHGLELKVNELDYLAFDGTEKQSNGRMVKLEFSLMDIDTGFYEISAITGEGIDKGDKAGYKADTGALKYYLANTFMVATGDDPENESPESKLINSGGRKASPKQLAVLRSRFSEEDLAKLMETNGIQQLEDLPLEKASEIIGKWYGKQSN